MSNLTRPLLGYRFAEIHYGDTLQAIAARELGDAARWVDLVNINGLLPPFITGDPTQVSATVKGYGDYLLVPSTSTVSADTPTDASAIYLTDVALINGQLVPDATGDLLLVSGRDNLRQALSHRLQTGRRELLFHFDAYGCNAERVIGTANGPVAAMLAAQYVREALSEDDRVAAVNSVKATVSGDAVEVVAEIQPITGRPLSLSVGA